MGWFSIVLKDGHYHIRARVREDLENLRASMEVENLGDEPALPEIEEWPAADYRYRIRLPEGTPLIAEVFAALCWSIDYGNFKNEIAATPDQRDKLHAYHKIWGTMADLQD